LLWWQLLFKMAQTRAPKAIHYGADSFVLWTGGKLLESSFKFSVFG
jgi:hypothetical protein